MKYIIITVDQARAIAAVYRELVSVRTLNPERAATADEIVLMHDVLPKLETNEGFDKLITDLDMQCE
jgi:hypothetical protein